MKLALMACVAFAGLLAVAPAQENKTPADWVKQLGAGTLAERDAASAALLALGAKAREEVGAAVDAKDPEVQTRAKELWKTLRWQVVPGAEEDIKQMAVAAEQEKLNDEQWRAFVKKYGAASLHLAAEFKISGAALKTYQPCLPALLEVVPSMEVARVISHPTSPGEEEAFDAILDGVQPGNIQPKTARSWMQIQIALWQYEKAYNFGRDVSFAHGGDEVAKLSAVAVERGQILDKTLDAARKDISSESDPTRLCLKLGFYVSLLSEFGKQKEMEALCITAEKVKTATATDSALRNAVEILMKVNMPAHAVKILHNAQSPQALYMRSSADIQLGDTIVAGTDWRESLAAIDALEDSKKKETIYSLGELMRDWHDERAEFIWQKMLSMAPANTVYDANACFRLGEVLEARRDYAHAADLYEKGMTIAAGTQGILIATRSDGGSAGGTEVIVDKIKKLRAQAAGQKSLFNAPVEGNNDQNNLP